MREEHDKETGSPPFDLGAFDLDGTVLRHDLSISPRTVEALRRLRTRGVRLVVATGRRFEGAHEYAGRLGFGDEDPVICYGGSMVRRMSGETLLHRRVPRDVSVEALRWAAERGLHARVFIDGKTVVAPDSPASVAYLRAGEDPDVVVVDSPADWLEDGREEPTKLVFVDQPDEIEDWLEEARAAFAGKLFVTRSLPHYVEVGGLEGTKSSALEFLCDYWGVDPSRVAAFGDADNDVDMLRFAGVGVSVGGRTEEIRAAADIVAEPIDEDGVARYIEKVLGGS